MGTCFIVEGALKMRALQPLVKLDLLVLNLDDESIAPYCTQQSTLWNALINPLKTKRICFIQGLSAYRVVNTLHFGYKNQSLNVL
jgi:hypothetical protein